MEITSERLIEILEENFEILMLKEDIGVRLEVLSITYDGKCSVELTASNGLQCMSTISLYVDTSHYDEKFVYADKYDIPDVGIIIEIVHDEILEDFNEINIWKNLFFNKE